MARSGRTVRVALGLAAGAALLGGVASLVAQERDAEVGRGQRIFAEQRCLDCHTVGATGTPIAPSLSRVGLRYREADLARWLRDPAAQLPTRHMPRIELGEADARSLAAYLSTLR